LNEFFLVLFFPDQVCIFSESSCFCAWFQWQGSKCVKIFYYIAIFSKNYRYESCSGFRL
jgi:hypothetical protein